MRFFLDLNCKEPLEKCDIEHSEEASKECKERMLVVEEQTPSNLVIL
jgi:hypothetical protein